MTMDEYETVQLTSIGISNISALGIRVSVGPGFLPTSGVTNLEKLKVRPLVSVSDRHSNA